MATIKRDLDGIVDFCMEQVEKIDQRDDLDIEKRLKYQLSLLREVRGFAGMNLQFKRLVQQAPEIATNPNIVLQIGSGKAAPAIEKTEG